MEICFLSDFIAVKPITGTEFTKTGLIIHVQNKKVSTARATVRYVGENCKSSIAVGDIVFYDKSHGVEVNLPGEDYDHIFVMREGSVIAKAKPEPK